jgi:hypothetical protein
MPQEDLPQEVRRGMVHVALLVGIPAVLVGTAGVLYTDNPYISVAVMVTASVGMAYERYDRGYFNPDEWDDI